MMNTADVSTTCFREHTSIFKTLLEVFNLSAAPLSPRAAAAPQIMPEHLTAGGAAAAAAGHVAAFLRG